MWLAGLHAAAAIFHHVVLKDVVLSAMLPWGISLRDSQPANRLGRYRIGLSCRPERLPTFSIGCGSFLSWKFSARC
jgi:hypothetical protein